MRHALVALLSVAGLAACQSTAPYTVPAAAVNTAIAAGVSAGRRADGECYSPCGPGTKCNPKTGFCDTLPCRGECQAWQRCDESGVLYKCVDESAPALGIERKKGEKPPGEKPVREESPTKPANHPP